MNLWRIYYDKRSKLPWCVDTGDDTEIIYCAKVEMFKVVGLTQVDLSNINIDKPTVWLEVWGFLTQLGDTVRIIGGR